MKNSVNRLCRIKTKESYDDIFSSLERLSSQNQHSTIINNKKPQLMLKWLNIDGKCLQIIIENCGYSIY